MNDIKLLKQIENSLNSQIMRFKPLSEAILNRVISRIATKEGDIYKAIINKIYKIIENDKYKIENDKCKIEKRAYKLVDNLVYNDKDAGAIKLQMQNIIKSFLEIANKLLVSKSLEDIQLSLSFDKIINLIKFKENNQVLLNQEIINLIYKVIKYSLKQLKQKTIKELNIDLNITKAEQDGLNEYNKLLAKTNYLRTNFNKDKDTSNELDCLFMQPKNKEVLIHNQRFIVLDLSYFYKDNIEDLSELKGYYLINPHEVTHILHLLIDKYHHLCSYEFKKTIIKSIKKCIFLGVDINTKNSNGKTILHIAVETGNSECVQQLLAKKEIDINAQDNARATSLHIAAFYNNSECIVELLKAKDINVNAVNEDGQTALHIAVKNNNLQCVAELLKSSKIKVNAKDEKEFTPLHIAADQGSLACIQKLLEKTEIEINAKNKFGRTALHYTIKTGNLKCIQKLLVRKEIEINIQDEKGITPLHIAILANSLKCIQKLLARKKIEVNTPNEKGMTPLHVAAFYNKSECIAELLKAKDINVNAQDKFGRTALHIAAEKGNSNCISELLKAERINVYILNEKEATPLHCTIYYNEPECALKLLKSNKINIDTTDKYGNTALHYAVIYKKPAIFALLMELGAKTDIENNNKYTVDALVANISNTLIDKALAENVAAEDTVQNFYGYDIIEHFNNALNKSKPQQHIDAVLNYDSECELEFTEEEQTFLMHENKPDAQSQDAFGQNAFEQNALDQDQDQDILGE